jgi:hypothetical protein
MNHERAKIARIEQILSGYQELQDINVHLMAQHIAEAITEEHELIIRRQAQIIEELETERELTKSVQTAQPSEQDRIVTLRAHIDAGLFEELHAARLTLADTATIERIHRRIDEMFDAALSTDSAPPQKGTLPSEQVGDVAFQTICELQRINMALWRALCAAPFPDSGVDGNVDPDLYDEWYAVARTNALIAHNNWSDSIKAALSTDSAPPQNTTEMQWLSGELEGRLAAALDDLRVADTSDRAVATLKFLLLRAKEIASGAPPQNTAQPSKPKPSMPCAICGERRDLHALPMQCPESMKEWSVVTVFTPAAVPREHNAPAKPRVADSNSYKPGDGHFEEEYS